MGYNSKNYNVERLVSQLAYWGAFSLDQASYFLEHFYHVEYAADLIDSYCINRQLCYLHGKKNIISISNFPYLTFTDGKEKCIEVYFAYLDDAIQKGAKPKLITKNEFNGVDFVLWNRYYSLVYIPNEDKTYQSILKTKHDEAKHYIFVVSNERRASTIAKINADDDIWIVRDGQRIKYEG